MVEGGRARLGPKGLFLGLKEKNLRVEEAECPGLSQRPLVAGTSHQKLLGVPVPTFFRGRELIVGDCKQSFQLTSCP